MFSKLLILIVVSVLVVFFPNQAAIAMQWVLQFHAYVADFLAGIFSDGQVGHLIRDFLGLLVLPVLVGALCSLLYWLVRRKTPTCFSIIVWSFWLIQLAPLVVLHKV